MASIAHDGSGFRRILFMLNGKREKIHLGKMSAKTAGTIKAHVEAIIECKNSGRSLYDEPAKWLRTIDDGLHGKLVAKGLAAPRQKAEQAALGAFIDGYFAKRTDIKPNTWHCAGKTLIGRVVE